MEHTGFLEDSVNCGLPSTENMLAHDKQHYQEASALLNYAATHTPWEHMESGYQHGPRRHNWDFTSWCFWES